MIFLTKGERMKTYREVIEEILSTKIKVATVDVEKEFVHLDKFKGEWRLVITKSLLTKEQNDNINR
jgi:hypothetical protein